MHDTSMTLPDGRVLAYTDIGEPGGPLVVHSHGAPSSRLELTAFEEAFSELGVRVVCADRPGYGGSSPKPGRRMAEWAWDVAAVADHLGMQRFAVMGASTGGPYAVACAAILPNRVASAAVVCGATDFGWANAWDDYPNYEAELMRIGDEVQAATWCEARYGSDGSRFLEGGVVEMPQADEATLADEAIAAALYATVREAFRQGVGGYAQDVVAQGRPWTFDVGAIASPVWVLHGEADTDTPVAHARHTADVIPGAKLLLLPGHGHISILTEIPQLTARLVSSLR
jgi:pimeloyl-ACP methyl ester carboxylesterase